MKIKEFLKKYSITLMDTSLGTLFSILIFTLSIPVLLKLAFIILSYILIVKEGIKLDKNKDVNKNLDYYLANVKEPDYFQFKDPILKEKINFNYLKEVPNLTKKENLSRVRKIKKSR